MDLGPYRYIVKRIDSDYADYLVFEFDTIRYGPDLYRFEWNKRMNLEGHEKSLEKHKFTWQPGGSQFTIIEDIPEKRLHIFIKKPEKVAKEKILEAVNFDSSWYRIVSDYIVSAD